MTCFVSETGCKTRLTSQIALQKLYTSMVFSMGVIKIGSLYITDMDTNGELISEQYFSVHSVQVGILGFSQSKN